MHLNKYIIFYYDILYVLNPTVYILYTTTHSICIYNFEIILLSTSTMYYTLLMLIFTLR